ncbi:HNH/ENDO VII family nuclease [Floccifex sp.]|uniref:HNH/ENDO VII family nuclease n=1 Tax=Floccifex sp. TaxID=2815810 RepID=UPI003F121CF4
MLCQISRGEAKGSSLYGESKQTAFTINEYAKIQKESGYPVDVIKQFHTIEEYDVVFKKANLKSVMVGDKSALVRFDIDLNRKDSKGRTNLERMKQGLAPKDSKGLSYELHHVGQKKDGTLAILTQEEHDNKAIHGFLKRTEAHAEGTNWNSERRAFWKNYAELIEMS